MHKLLNERMSDMPIIKVNDQYALLQSLIMGSRRTWKCIPPARGNNDAWEINWAHSRNGSKHVGGGR
ncbi:MAG: hypothetical protein GDYSWBUE_000105 [Candidatus Fervidibacterota bacterium]